VVSVRVDGRVFDLGPLEPGAVVGEVGVCDPGPATATVTAEEPSQVLVMDRAALDAVAAAEPRVATAVLRTLSATLSARVRSMEERIDEILLMTDPQLSLVAQPAPPSGLLYYFRTLFGGRRG
jgi:CRP-like cAMP-binding protein